MKHESNVPALHRAAERPNMSALRLARPLLPAAVGSSDKRGGNLPIVSVVIGRECLLLSDRDTA